MSRLVKKFLDEPLKKTVTPKKFAYQHDKFISGIFNTSIPLSASVESILSLGITTFFVKRD